MTLAEYRRKRRFDKTREPEPGRLPAGGERPIFVVQLHHASSRHYDFRLQVGDSLKSWAVPKGPSLDPKVKRLAAEVEDHPIAYASFEGDIPEGQYGAGHVDIFDGGAWSTEGDAQAQLDEGHLKFQLFGQRLKGGWHLVRSRRPSRRPQWLLFKQRDEYAAADTEADDLLEDSRSRRPAGKAGKAGKRRQLQCHENCKAQGGRWREVHSRRGARRQAGGLGQCPPAQWRQSRPVAGRRGRVAWRPAGDAAAGSHRDAVGSPGRQAT